MSTETQVSSVADTEIPATELTNEAPEVVTPEVVAETPEPAESEESKALKRMQRRIDKRTADVYRERAEKDQLAQRIAELERRQPPEQTQDPQADIRKVVETKAQSLAQEIVQQQRVAEHIGDILKAGKAIPNFDAACNAVDKELPFFDDNGRPTAFLSAVMEFDHPAKLLAHLGANLDLADELAELTPTRRVLKLASIQSEMEAASKPRASTAPKPLEPVRGQGASKEPSEMSDAEFAAWRRRQIAQRR